jgi:aspartate aminotransferase
MEVPMKLAARMSRLGTESAFEVLARARALEAKGVDVVHLEIGEPDFNTPRNICDAAIKAINKGYTHYTTSQGLPELRAEIAKNLGATRGVSFDPDRIVVTTGAKPIMFYSILALLGEGDEAIYQDPLFPIYESMINFSGATAVPIPLREELGFRMDVDELRSKVTSRTKLIIINSPQNPSGGVMEEEDIRAIAEIAREHDIIVLSDEIYDYIMYEGKNYSIASQPDMLDRTILLNGFSKTYAMTGWRMGYGFFPTELVTHIVRLVTNSISCAPPIVQHACIEALRGPQDSVPKMVAEFKKRRDLIVDGLNKISGISCHRPKGAFYVFPNIKKLGMSANEFSDYLLNKAGVASLSGTAFGANGEGYLRLSYATSQENIKKALEKIEAAVAKL